MAGMESIGRVLLLAGGVLALLGLHLMLGDRIPLLGRLPGDFLFRTDSIRIYVPLATMLLLSVVLSIVLTIILRLFR